jgi:hypothetical protein
MSVDQQPRRCYSYRVALTGIHLMRTGTLEPNLLTLAPEFGYGDVAELAALKRAGVEHGPVPPTTSTHTWSPPIVQIDRPEVSLQSDRWSG